MQLIELLYIVIPQPAFQTLSFYILPETCPSAEDSSYSSELELDSQPSSTHKPVHKCAGLCFIYSGFLPVGRFLYRNYCCNTENISKCIHEVRALTITQESMIHGSVSEIVIAIRSYILSQPGFSNSDILRIMISTSDHFYSLFASFLRESHWRHVSSLEHIYCQPSIAVDYWQSQYRLLEKIYRRNMRSKIRLVDFSSLSSSEWNSIKTTPHPMWASPSHPSLETDSTSLSSFVAFLNSMPCAWLIANYIHENSLTIETIWIDKSICSSAVLYSMIFLSFSSFFGYSPSLEKTFQFAYLTSNKKMRVFSEWLKPFQVSSSFVHTYDSTISRNEVAV